jgi:hypothetical protein
MAKSDFLGKGDLTLLTFTLRQPIDFELANLKSSRSAREEGWNETVCVAAQTYSTVGRSRVRLRYSIGKSSQCGPQRGGVMEA